MAEYDRETIADKVRKLLNLSQSSAATPAEAINYATQAAEMVLRYNLQEHELVLKGTATAAAYGHAVLRRMGRSYKQQLAYQLAKNNFCDAIYLTVTNETEALVDVVGQPGNVEVVLYLYAFIKRAVGGMQRRDYDERSKQPGWDLGPGKHKTAYWTGAVTALRDKLDAQRANDVSADDVRALVAIKDQALADAVRRFHPTMRESLHIPHVVDEIDEEAYEAGYQAGKSLNPFPALREG